MAPIFMLSFLAMSCLTLVSTKGAILHLVPVKVLAMRRDSGNYGHKLKVPLSEAMITKRKMEEAVFPADGLKTKSEVDAIAQWKSARLRTARGLRRCLAGMLLCPRPQRKHEKSENNRREDQGSSKRQDGR